MRPSFRNGRWRFQPHAKRRWLEARPHRRWLTHFVIVGTLVPVVTLPSLTASTPSGTPLYAFSATGNTSVPWSSASLEPLVHNLAISGTPSVISGNGVIAIAGLNASGDLVLGEQTPQGILPTVDLTSGLAAPVAASAPVAFFDPFNNVDVAYVATSGNLMLIVPNLNLQHHWGHFRSVQPDQVLNLSANQATLALGTPSVGVVGKNCLIAATDTTGDLEVLSLTWSALNAPPIASPMTNVTTTSNSPTLLSEPRVVSAATTPLLTALVSGHNVEMYAGTAASAWTALNVTLATGAPIAVASVVGTATTSTTYVASLASNGDVQLFTVPAGAETANVHARVITQPSTQWVYTDVSTAAPGTPPLAGTLALAVSPGQITIAGQSANLNDLYTVATPLPTTAWTSSDLSKTASGAAFTVGPVVSSGWVNGVLTLFATNTGYATPKGVGVYAIPQADWSRAISDGWPIVADTGALGTTQAPWVGYVTTGGVAQSPDYLLGTTVAASHKSETWISFWTVSGPLSGQAQGSNAYYTHGFQAGVWVAQQIDQYATLGLSVAPNWVVFDPEGYPDNHSNLDAPPGSSAAVFATYGSYWASMVHGWIDGLASIDPLLHPGLYAAQSEYGNYHLAALDLPVFVALAFGGNGPSKLSTTNGSNIRGYIAFNASCSPTSTLKAQEATLTGSPWFGQFNTLQFNPGVYCHP